MNFDDMKDNNSFQYDDCDYDCDCEDGENDYETTDWNKLDWQDFEIEVELEETVH